MRDSFRSFVYILYCIEGGLFLVLVPWSPIWPRIYYFERFAALAAAGLHPVARGVVSAVGALLMVHGVQQVLGLAARRRREREARP